MCKMPDEGKHKGVSGGDGEFTSARRKRKKNSRSQKEEEGEHIEKQKPVHILYTRKNNLSKDIYGRKKNQKTEIQ